jgi:nicotinamide mononucleotide transporter PnuC
MLENKKLSGVAVFDYVLAVLTLAAIVASGVIFRQMFIKILPCCISLVVLILSANANRYAYLVGGVNSLIYAVGYFMEDLYGSTIQAILTGFLFQILVFFRWKRRAQGHTTTLKSLRPVNKMILIAATAAISIGCSFIFKALGGSNALLDSAHLILALTATALAFFAYIDQWLFTGAATIGGLILWCFKISGDIKAITYLIFTCYNIVKIAEGFIKWNKQYQTQKTEKEQV